MFYTPQQRKKVAVLIPEPANIPTARAERSPEPEPEPAPNPDCEPEPEPESDPASAAQIDKAFMVALLSMLADTITSALRRPLTYANEEPLTLPTRPRPPLPAAEPLPLRAIPEAAPLPSARLNPMVGDRLQALRNQIQDAQVIFRPASTIFIQSR